MTELCMLCVPLGEKGGHAALVIIYLLDYHLTHQTFPPSLSDLLFHVIFSEQILLLLFLVLWHILLSTAITTTISVRHVAIGTEIRRGSVLRFFRGISWFYFWRVADWKNKKKLLWRLYCSVLSNLSILYCLFITYSDIESPNLAMPRYETLGQA